MVIEVGIVITLGWRVLTRRDHKRSFWGTRNLLYLKLDDGYMDVYTCKNSLSCSLKIPILCCK